MHRDYLAAAFDALFYEGFGPGESTIIIDCLTNNVNRTVSAVKTCFNKAHAKMGVSGCVSHSYDEVGLFVLKYTDEEAMLDALMMAEVDVIDIEVEEDTMTITTSFADFAKAQDAISELIPDVTFEVCEVTMLPQDYVTIDNPEDKELWDRLLNLLNECEDVNKIYHNVK